MTNNFNVTFASFRIREVQARDHRNPGVKKLSSGVMQISPEVSFACPEVIDPAALHMLVIVRLSSALLKSKSENSQSSADAVIEAEGRFDMSGIKVPAFKKLFHNMDFLDGLADQVYPLVNNRMVQLLNEMGFNSSFPLSLPSKNSREIMSVEERDEAISKLVELDKGVSKKVAARKPIAKRISSLSGKNK